MNKFITVFVDGGVVTDVTNLPEGWGYQVHDWDNGDVLCPNPFCSTSFKANFDTGRVEVDTCPVCGTSLKEAIRG